MIRCGTSPFASLERRYEVKKKCADVEDVAKTIDIKTLTELHYQKTQKFFLSFVADGTYYWASVIADGLRDAEEELRAGYGDVTEKRKK